MAKTKPKAKAKGDKPKASPRAKGIPVSIGRADLLRHFPRAKGHFFAPGAVILREGAAADSCFYLHAGKVAVSKKGRDRTTFDLGTLSPGAFFGEMAMLSGGRRNASITALTRVEAIEITRAEFDLATRSGNPQAARLALHFAVELANRSTNLLKLLGRQAAAQARASKQTPIDVRQILHKVYSLWAV